jgi:hypothetical protein
MKSPKSTNGKKVNPRGGGKFSRLSPNITQWCLLGGLFWLHWLFGDGMTVNHNEMFLADLS